ncbi:MAG: RluA family pseudouridine synthase [Lachnospiraceae bacterium]|nr:RluA family pseudouridine synthase [Candidatus Colinaster equi]
MKQIRLEVDDEFEGIRLDKYITLNTESIISRSFLQKLIKSDLVKVNFKPQKASYLVKSDDVIEFEIPDPQEYIINPENIPLDILYEDDDVIVVNKPKGMVVHPAAGHYTGTLVNGLLYHCKDSLSGINGVLRPGIVHRIDKDTTGSVIACKNDVSHNEIAAQLKEHTITRRYRAICHGTIKEDELTINAPIGRSDKDRKKMAINSLNGKSAITHVKVLERLNGYTYIECRLETGRTHQIRVHMASIGHPLLGDDVYSNIKSKYNTNGQCLHAYILGFVHPTTKQYIETCAPIPEYMTKLLSLLHKI